MTTGCEIIAKFKIICVFEIICLLRHQHPFQYIPSNKKFVLFKIIRSLKNPSVLCCVSRSSAFGSTGCISPPAVWPRRSQRFGILHTLNITSNLEGHPGPFSGSIFIQYNVLWALRWPAIWIIWHEFSLFIISKCWILNKLNEKKWGRMERQEIDHSKNRLMFMIWRRKSSKFWEFQSLEKRVKCSNPWIKRRRTFWFCEQRNEKERKKMWKKLYMSWCVQDEFASCSICI